jgi:beta-glucoside operon transcriptional antiterminator
MGVPFQNPFLWEIKKFYYREYLIGQAALRMIEKELKVTLPQDEAAFIALHIVNAELDLDMTEMVSMTKMVNHILEIVDECFPDQIDKESVFYERFITHLKFFAQRMFAGKEVESDDTEFQEIIMTSITTASSVWRDQAYLKETLNHDVTR